MRRLCLVAIVLSLAPLARANDLVALINFEQYSEYTQIANQYQAEGLTFQNALQLVAPFYDYFDYPPHSGSGVITNDPSDPIQVNFVGPEPIYLVTGWYSDPDGIIVNAYNAANSLVATFTGPSVDGTTALFSVEIGSPFAYITIGDNGGSPDDLTVDDLAIYAPEPSSYLLLGTGFMLLAFFKFHKSLFRKIGLISMLFAVAALTTLSHSASAQGKPTLVKGPINENNRVTLAGNTRPEAIAANDQGAVNANMLFDHMLLALNRPPALETQLESFINELHNPSSASFHKWIDSVTFGELYGPADSDIAAVTSWLESHGMKVNAVYNNKMFIDFTGTAGQITDAFHTGIHNYAVNGGMYVANNGDPQVPAALAGVVKGVLYLHNFKPRSYLVRRNEAHIDSKSGAFKPNYTAGGGFYPIAPWDLEKIYNIAPLLSAGVSGQGMKIVVVEDTNQWNCKSGAPGAATSANPTQCSPTSDWAVFRNVLGLGRYTSGQFFEETPGTTTTTTCNVPSTESGAPAGSGINSDDIEATIDAEWATSAAPSATIINAACANPRGGFGGLTAIQNILNHPNADNVDVISMSYGESEEVTGATLNAAFNTTFQQAVTAGIGIFVSSGDELAASSDGGGSLCSGLPPSLTFTEGPACAKDGISISGWMSSPYDVSVGGLDFADTAEGLNSTYWGNNNVFYGSAKSYIMEQPWNDSCAGTILSTFITGLPVTYGTNGFCNSTIGMENFLLAIGGSGGPSGCATGTVSVRGVDGGTCAGYAKPAFQSSYIGSMAGLQNDGVRDTPDVALMAANGLWGHYYVVCFTDRTTDGIAQGGIPSCTGAGVSPALWPGYGGTSVSSPIMAAIQSLVVQHKGSLQGNPNNRYYALAANEYGPSGSASCNSALGNGVASSCIFYDVTLGDIDANCQAHSGGTFYNCYLPSGYVGVLSTNNGSFNMAYPTTTGWDFGSGIGSVNAYNLVMNY